MLAIALAVLAAAIAGTAIPAAAQERSITTDRPKPRLLPLPKQDDVFHFAVFGDRTGGPKDGVQVLAQAVADVNLLDPDLVMTVGDLVQGYNATPQWLQQMREFKTTMAKLRMPWFPVAGNHDIYWRGANRPPGEHERDYESHFGPLWYAFEHKRCWFVVLYSDEGDPETGSKGFSSPASQRMSEAQFDWLRATLQKAKGARHVFVFLHHPRWLGGGYGDDWQRVHALLAKAGNVRAVFAGHIHHMRFDGVRDGIEYHALATTGGSLSHHVPGGGYLHHFDVVTVRPEGIRVAAVPVGAVLDPRQVTGDTSDDVAKLAAELAPQCPGPALRLSASGACAGELEVHVHNPARRPIEVTVLFDCRDGRWQFLPDHTHAVLAAGERRAFPFALRREAAPLDAAFALPDVVLRADYLAEGLRVTIPEARRELPVLPPEAVVAAGGDRANAPLTPAPDTASGGEGVLWLDGRSGCLRVDDLDVPDGPFTLEGWCRAGILKGRRAFLNKTETSEYGLFVTDAVPEFMVFVSGRYASASAEKPLLADGEWHHLAGVFDGAEVRLYVDGRLVARRAGKGERRRNALPLYVGADPDRRARPESHFTGLIDEVRVSRVARYAGELFRPERRFAPDDATLLLLHLDHDVGPWVHDASARAAHPRRVGSARCGLENVADVR